ncbi:MAG TPA: hypothetical protein VGD53_23975 [Actinoallomurus sp.]|jgi:hypothetical protein
MKIRTRLAGAIAGTAFAGLTALAVGTAVPAGAQQVRPSTQTVSAAPQLSQSCWDDDCGGGWDDDGWDSWGDSWGGGWDSWGGGW